MISSQRNRMWLLALCLVQLAACEAAAPVAPERHGYLPTGRNGVLRFKPDGTFKLVQLTDLHYGEDAGLDVLTNKVQEVVLGREKPSLAVLAGDMVSGFAWPGRPGWYAELWERLIQPVHAAGLPYAVALGNHDREADLSAEQILDLDIATSNTTLTQQGPPGVAGASNYHLDIYDSEGSVVAGRIWMLDSNNRGCGLLRAGWGCVERSTLAWVERTARKLPSVVPSLAFIHIPVPEFMAAWNVVAANGSKAEWVSCPILDSHAFKVLRAAGIQAVYSGHDHNNDFVGMVDGIRLAYGRKTGYGCYGPPPGVLRGARVIELRQGESAAGSRTWIRQEDGTRVEQAPVSLAAKAGSLQYTCISSSGLFGWAWTLLRHIQRLGPLGGAAVLGAVAAAVAAVVVLQRLRAPLQPLRRGERLRRQLFSRSEEGSQDSFKDKDLELEKELL